MLKHAVLTAIQIERLPPEKRASVTAVTMRRKNSVFNNFGVVVLRRGCTRKRIQSLSWPNSSEVHK